MVPFLGYPVLYVGSLYSRYSYEANCYRYTVVSTCHVVTILIYASFRPMTRLLMCVHYLKTVNVTLLLS